jgi:protocatechuate 3,4-dioxygenase beta subunit
MNDDALRITRRRSLLSAGGALMAAVASGCGIGGGSEGGSATTPSGPEGVASGRVSCVLAPEQTEGPFYLSDSPERRDVTEGRPGTALALALEVVNASSCEPIRGAIVDIWHTDALGEYSGVAGSGGSFMRGIQRAGADGVARFDTVYPGWYMGRAVHIHVKVHVGGGVVHTGQLYFPDEVTDAAYEADPYSTRPGPDVRNDADAIFRNGGSRSLLDVRENGDGYAASITMGVQAA